MTTVIISPRHTATPRPDGPLVPVEIKPAEETGKYWLKQAGQLPRPGGHEECLEDHRSAGWGVAAAANEFPGY